MNEENLENLIWWLAFFLRFLFVVSLLLMFTWVTINNHWSETISVRELDPFSMMYIGVHLFMLSGTLLGAVLFLMGVQGLKFNKIKIRFSGEILRGESTEGWSAFLLILGILIFLFPIVFLVIY